MGFKMSTEESAGSNHGWEVKAGIPFLDAHVILLTYAKPQHFSSESDSV